MNEPVRSFRDMRVWQSAEDLCVQVYKLTSGFPKHEQFGLTSQLRRAAISISSNIAEGFGRRSAKEKEQFYHHALGSLFEVESQISISVRLGYVDAADAQGLQDESEKTKALLLKLIAVNGQRIR
jgi:four helix bundle protein